MSSYPFVDIAVLDAVRRHFAAGDALVVLARELGTVLWANGAGLELFGLGALDDALSGQTALDDIQRRQIMAALPAAGVETMLHMRFVQAPQTILLPVHLSIIRLPDAEHGVLLRIPMMALKSRHVARDTLNAIEDAGSHAAFIKPGAQVVSRSSRFSMLDIDAGDLARMMAEASGESDRLVKRPVMTAKGPMPAALARLTDEDGLHLLLVVGADEADGPVDGEEHGSATDVTDTTSLIDEPAYDTGGDSAPLVDDAQPEEPEFAAIAVESDGDAGPIESDAPAESNAAPVRFAWKSGADGTFADISPAFLEAFNLAPEAILGRSFGEIAGRLGIVDNGGVAAMFERRDTWSGRTVLWPLGDGSAAPVELAALPVFSRDRAFEGFRGFGIARLDQATLIEAAAQETLADEAAAVPFGRKVRALETDGDAIAEPAPPLNAQERQAFEEIGARLRVSGEEAAFDAQPQVEDAVKADTLATAPAESPAAADPHSANTHIVSKLPLPVLIYSETGLHFANEEFLALAGYEALDDIAQAGGLDALFADPHGEDAAAETHGMQLHHADGHVIDIHAHLQSVPWNGGKALMLAIAPRRAGKTDADAAALDAMPDGDSPEITDAYRQIEELTAILDTATDGVVVLEHDGAIRSLNNAAEALFGYDEADVRGQHFNTLLAIESHRSARDYIHSLTDNGVASVLNDGREMIGREREGRFIPLFVTIGRLASSDGYCAVIRDVTNFKRAEEELTSARRDAESASSNKSEFLARISHEIRTPLNAIIGFSELMMNERFGALNNERYRNYAADIHSSGTLVLQLVNDLLDISRIEAGAQALDFRAVNLNTVVGDALAILQPQANRERVLLRTSLADPLPELVADERSLKQIILNLVSNAIRFTDAGGQVIISTAYEADGNLSLRVRDTGIGMNDNELADAMKPYRQVGNRPQSEAGGTGLGLPLARALAESNKAEFRIRSTPGHGTVVEIEFPASRVLAG